MLKHNFLLTNYVLTYKISLDLRYGIILPGKNVIACGETKNPEQAFACSGLVGEGGFEPPKALPTDLQSAPFGHSGIPPDIKLNHHSALYQIERPAKRVRFEEGRRNERIRSFRREAETEWSEFLLTGAGGRTRTPDLLITNQLLYQLSYTSGCFAHAIPATVILTNCAGFVNIYFSFFLTFYTNHITQENPGGKLWS